MTNRSDPSPSPAPQPPRTGPDTALPSDVRSIDRLLRLASAALRARACLLVAYCGAVYLHAAGAGAPEWREIPEADIPEGLLRPGAPIVFSDPLTSAPPWPEADGAAFRTAAPFPGGGSCGAVLVFHASPLIEETAADILRDSAAQLAVEVASAAGPNAHAGILANAPDVDAILEGLPGCVWESVLDGPDSLTRIVRISRSVERMLGYPAEEWLNDPSMMLRTLHPDDRATVTDANRRSDLPDAPTVIQQRFIARDGAVKWMEVRFTPRRDDQGRLVGYRGVTVDITERRRAEQALRESEERYRRIVETSLEGICIFDAQARTTYVNRRMADLLGYAPEEMLGRCALTFVEDGADGLQPVQQHASRWDPHTQHDVRLRHRDGSTVWTTVAITPVLGEDGSFQGGVGMVTDITAHKQTEEALRRSERRYRMLAENATDMISRVDRDFRVVYVNPVSEQMIGLPPSSLIGTTMADLGASPEQIAWWNERLTRVFDRGEHVTVEFETGGPIGRRYFQTRMVPEYDEDGTVTSCLSICRDITERRRTEEQQRFLAGAGEILSGSLDFDVTMESVTRLTVPYLADCCMVDVLQEDNTFRRVAVAHVDPEKEVLVRELRRRYPFTMDQNISVPLVVKTGRPILTPEAQDEWWVAVASDDEELRLLREIGLMSSIIVPLTARGRNIGAMTLMVTTLDRSYTTDDLALAEELARRCALAMDNARLYGEVRRMSRAKDEFLAMLGHELRNPLASLGNALEAVRQDAARFPEVRNDVEREVFHMTRLVGDLLDVARITRGQIHLRREPMDLNAAAIAAVHAMQPLVGTRRHALDLRLPEQSPWVNGDPVRLHQILCNLLHNAAKFTPPEGRIRVTVGTDSDGAVISCADNGVGIPRESLATIFDVFAQPERRLDRTDGGLGIGLTLVRSLVELHGGSVEARSDGEGTGSEFLIHIPVCDPPPDADTRAAPARVDTDPLHVMPDAGARTEDAVWPEQTRKPETGRRVLVVEDNDFSARMLARILEAAGHAVRVVHDGPAAIADARSDPPDVILLDIGLPNMDGYEVARCLRDDPRLRHVTFIALTGYGREEDRERSIAAGFHHHLVKPVDFDALESLLAGLPIADR